jgi:glycine cleavage system H lipoate-binding protein
MTSSPVNTNLHGLPAEQFRCVWMLAGVLSYQLCDREFDCDNCPLDAAMRKHFQPPPESGKRKATATKTSSGVVYSRNHCWMRKVATNTFRVGIEPRLAELLVSIKEIVLPPDGGQLERGKTCLWIVLDGGTFPLSAPFDGVVHATNPRLVEQPHELLLHPTTRGWMYELTVDSEKELSEQFMREIEAELAYKKDFDGFNTRLAETLHSLRPGVGPTLYDGGQKVAAIRDMIGSKRYFGILREIFS